jgi:hypothetical protein
MRAPAVPFVRTEPEPAAGLLDDYLTVDQLAAELDVAPITVKRWQALKQGPPLTRVGRRVLYRRASVQQWLVRQEQ